MKKQEQHKKNHLNSKKWPHVQNWKMETRI